MAKRVLLIDDQPEILEMMQAILASEGYEVTTCPEGHAAPELARLTRPDVIVLDIQMPDISGWSVLDQLRRDPETRNVPVVVSTAATREVEQAREKLRRSHCKVLLRPFDFDALLHVVAEAVDLRSAC